MPTHFEMFNKFITKHVEFTENELVAFNKKCSQVNFSKGELIMKAGEVQQNLYFLTKGIIRNFVENKKGEIKIYNFRSENMTVTGYATYNYEDNLKALVNVECLESALNTEMDLYGFYGGKSARERRTIRSKREWDRNSIRSTSTVYDDESTETLDLECQDEESLA